MFSLRLPLISFVACIVTAQIRFGSAAEPIPGTVVLKSRKVEAHVIPTGVVIQKLLVASNNGNFVDIVLGYDTLEPYLNGSSPYFGAVIGRVANRIANASFTLDGRIYNISANDGNNTLHGGTDGWSRRNWTFVEVTPSSLVATLRSPAGDNGFPGNVNATVVYNVTDDGQLLISFSAMSDAATPINMAQHSYFNLNGAGTGSTAVNHLVTINGSFITPVDAQTIPTGAFEGVQGTPFDFLQPRAAGERIDKIAFPPYVGGYDINYVLFGLTGEEAKADTNGTCRLPFGLQKAATVESPVTGIRMDILTDAPGLQFYSGNAIQQTVAGKNGTIYPVHGALCFESQMFPNFVKTPAFPQCTITPTNPYRHSLAYRFSTAAASQVAG